MAYVFGNSSKGVITVGNVGNSQGDPVLWTLEKLCSALLEVGALLPLPSKKRLTSLQMNSDTH